VTSGAVMAAIEWGQEPMRERCPKESCGRSPELTMKKACGVLTPPFQKQSRVNSMKLLSKKLLAMNYGQKYGCDGITPTWIYIAFEQLNNSHVLHYL
jgi:hypothetical protein